MPFLLMIFLTLVCLPELSDWPAPLGVGSLAWSLSWTFAGLFLVGLRGWQVTRRLTRGLDREPAARERLLRQYEKGRFRTELLLFIFYILALVVFGWGWTVAQLCQGPPPGPEA